jgi:hypothetical protein
MALAGLLGALLGAAGCRGGGASKTDPTPSASASAVPLGLTPELGARVLARVGDRTITLAEYAAVLEGMDRFERMRYQTADRRKQLLDEMIQVELLAREAERRGLATQPETKELVRQALRDAVLKDLRDKQPKPEELPKTDVRAYYDAHHDEFREPERRRIAHIVVGDAATAAAVLPLARSASPKAWGDLVAKYSTDAKHDAPPDLAGDLGFVTPPSFGQNDNAKVPDPVRAAAFQIADVDQVFDSVVADGKQFHVVRLVARNAPRDRAFEEAERTIRVHLLQDRFETAEKAYEAELAAKYPIKIDETALARVTVPKAAGTP